MTLTKTITSNIYTVTPYDVLIKCSCIANNIAITMPDAGQSFDKEVTIEKIDTTTNTVTVNGSTLYDIGDYITLKSDGKTWSIVDFHISFDAKEYFRFNLSPTQVPTTKGCLYFDSLSDTLALVLGNGVVYQFGEENYIRAINNSGGDFTNGKCVFLEDSSGAFPEINLADADNYANSQRTIGLITQDIDNGAFGRVTVFGLVRGLNTSSYTAGDCLYLSTTAGELTTTAPADGKARIKVGSVIVASATDGWIFVCLKEEKYMFGDPDAGNYSYFDADGVKVSKGDARVYEDLQFSVSNGKVPASNFPTYETLTTGTRAYSFDVNEYIDLQTNEPSHGCDFTQTVSFHAHVTNKTANTSGSSQYVKLEITCGYCAVDGTWTEFTANGEVEIPDQTSALTKQIVSINSSTLNLANVGLGGQITPVIKRITATGGTEYADVVFITQVGIHALNDQDGSRGVGSK